MKKIIRIIFISIISLVVLGGAGYWLLSEFFINDENDIASVVEKIEKREESKEKEKPAKDIKVGKKVDVDIEEGQLQIYLHQMTHQKIVANKKRGAIEMTEKNIANMLKIVKENYDYYEHSDFYEKTLKMWKKDDFSNAASVHNTIWNWHNGTVGRATGLMSEEQEEAYVESHFR